MSAAERERPDVKLRPVTSEDLLLFEARFGSAEGTGDYQWFGFAPTTSYRKRLEDDGLLGPDGGAMTVAVDNTAEAVGRVDWFKSSWGRPDSSWCWTIAIILLPEARGRGIGSAAQRTLVTYLFAHTRAERVQAWTDSANTAEHHALRHAGFQQEGTLRSAQWRGGRWHDQELYSILRNDVTPA